MKKKDKLQDKVKESKNPQDDNKTVANMNVEGFSWYKSKKELKNKEEIKALGVTKTERHAMLKGALKAYVPIFLLLIGGFSLVYWLLYFWMKAVS